MLFLKFENTSKKEKSSFSTTRLDEETVAAKEVSLIFRYIVACKSIHIKNMLEQYKITNLNRFE